jgi:hypothetical protein
MKSIWRLLDGLFIGIVLLTSTVSFAQSREETSLWASVKDSKDSEDYKAYLDKYPDGVYAPIAKRRITSLERVPATSSGAAATSGGSQGSSLDYPTVMHFCAAHCSTWNFQNGRMGDGQYGVTIVHWSPDSVAMNRSDPPNQWFPQGLKAVITGRMSPEHNKLVDGKITWIFGQSGTYDARVTWGSALDDIPGKDGLPAPDPGVAPSSIGDHKPDRDISKTLPTDQVANAQVDAGFRRWSAAWMFDRYVPGSARATERGFKDGTYIVRGLFNFVRGGARLTIPFAAAYTAANKGYAMSNLCYNDVSSGMTDCINPNSSSDIQRSAMQSQRFLGSIVALGLVAAMSSETCVKRYTFFGEEYLVCD